MSETKEPEQILEQVFDLLREYVHGVGDIENVLHLWRPVGGWGTFEE